MTTIVREVIKPNSTYGIHFVDEYIRKPFISLIKQILNNQTKLFISNKLCRDITNVEEQKDIITQCHNETHNGITETYNHIKGKHYWPNMKTTIINIINSCDEYLQPKYERRP